MSAYVKGTGWTWHCPECNDYGHSWIDVTEALAEASAHNGENHGDEDADIVLIPG